MSDELIPVDKEEFSLEQMKSKLDILEEQLQLLSTDIDTIKDRIPDSNIISPNFLKRAFTVWGHYVVAGFIIAVPFLCFTLGFVLLMAIFSQQ